MGTLFIIDAIKQGFIGIILTLDTLIYGLIGSAFKVFIALAGARLLSSETYFDIANKIYVIIGVLMLFVLAYAILRGIVDGDPEKAAKEHAGPKMLKNIIIAVLGLALAPSIFNLMYQAQGLILEQDVLGKLFFRIENTELVDTVDGEKNPDEYVKQIGGSVTATSLWQAFFHPAPDSGKEAKDITVDASGYFVDGAVGVAACAAGIGIMAAASWTGVGLLVGGVIAAVGCASAVGNVNAGIEAANYDNLSLEQAYNLTAGGETFGIYTAFLSCYTDDGTIDYLFIISTIAGAFALYAFVSFSIDMGIRAAKLAYLQIIAPVPLIMQVLPKFQENFKKYISSIVSTFLEVFVRISVVYVVVYIICHLSDMFSSADALWGNTDLSSIELLFAYAFLILGLIAFCRHAPEMITQTLGLPKGDMHLGIGKKLAEGGAFSAGSIAYGGIKTATSNWRKNGGKPFGNRVASAVAGMASGMGRATRENFLGPNHKEAQTWADLKNVGERAAQGAIDARERRIGKNADHAASVKQVEQFRKAVEDAEADMRNHPVGSAQYLAAEARRNEAERRLKIAQRNAAITAPVIRSINSAVDKLNRWSVGTVDTSRDERRAKFLQSIKDLNDQLSGTVAKEDDVKASTRAKAQMENMSVERFAYSEALKNGTAGNRSYDQWYADVAASYDWSAAASRQNAEIKRLDDELKDVTKRAIGRKLAEAASGIENDCSRTFTSYLQSHQAEIDEFKYTSMGTVDDPVLGKIETTISDYLTNNFGRSGFVTGLADFVKVSIDSMPANKKSTFEIKYQDSTGAPARIELQGVNGARYEDEFEVIISKEADGTSSAVFVDSHGNQVNVIDPDTGRIVHPINQEEITRFVRNHGLKKPSFVLTTDSSETFNVVGQSTTADHDMYKRTIVDSLKDIVSGVAKVTFKNASGNVETAEVTRSGDTYTYKVGNSTFNSESSFFAALDSSLGGRGVNNSDIQVVSDKAPGNVIISDMKDAAEREYDRFTYTEEYLEGQRMKREQNVKNKNDNK